MNFIGIDTYGGSDGNQNGPVAWFQAKASGIGYGLIRAAYGSDPDKAFAKNWPLMKKDGVVRGGYLFLRYPYKGVVPPSPEDQAKAVCNIVGALDQSDYPISIDLEFPGAGRADTWTDSGTKKPMTESQLMAWFLIAWRYIKAKYGVAPIIYTSARVWYDDLSNPNVPPEVKESLLWLARYAFNPGPAVLNASNVLDPPVPPPWAGDDLKDITYRGEPYTDDNWFLHQYMGDAKGLSIAALGFPRGDIDLNRMRPLQKGVTGERVKWLQRRLGIKLVDGKFGPQTDKAVRALQAAKNDLVPDGIVGPRTYAYLCWMNP